MRPSTSATTPQIRPQNVWARGLLSRLPGLREICRSLTEVEPSLDLAGVLERLRARHDELAVVTEGASWVGVVTLEDVLERIVGSLEDEFD